MKAMNTKILLPLVLIVSLLSIYTSYSQTNTNNQKLKHVIYDDNVEAPVDCQRIESNSRSLWRSLARGYFK